MLLSKNVYGQLLKKLVGRVICLKVHVSQFVPFLLLQYNQVPNATSISTTKTTAEEINTVSKGERSRGTCFGGVLVISSLQSNEKIKQNSVTIWIINSNLYTCIK